MNVLDLVEPKPKEKRTMDHERKAWIIEVKKLMVENQMLKDELARVTRLLGVRKHG